MKLILALLLLISVLSQVSFSATATWDGNVNYFDNSTSWSTNQVPGSNDSVVIQAVGSVVTADAPVDVETILLGDGQNQTQLILANTTTVQDLITVNINSSLTIVATTVTVNSINNAGDVNFNQSAILDGGFENYGFITVAGHTTVTGVSVNNATIEVSDSSILSLNNGTTLQDASQTNVLSSSLLNIMGDNNVITGSSELYIEDSNVTLSNTVQIESSASIVSAGVSVVTFSSATVTMSGDSTFAANNTVNFDSTKLNLYNNSQISFGSGSNVVSKLSTFYIDEQSFMFVESGSIDFQNDAVYLTLDGQLKVLNGSLSITGTSSLQDSSSIYCQDSTFDTQVTNFVLIGSSSFIIDGSTFNVSDSNFDLQDTTSLLFTNSVLDSLTSNHTFSINSVLKLSNISTSSLGQYSFADNAKAMVVENSNIQISNSFNFDDMSFLEIDNSQISFTGAASFQSGSYIVSTNSDITFADGSTVTFSENSSLQTSRKSTVTFDSNVEIGILNSTGTTFAFTQYGVIFVNSFDSTNATINFNSNNQLTLNNVDITSNGGQVTLSATNFTLANTDLTISNGNLTLGFNTIQLTNSSLSLVSDQQDQQDQQVLQSSPISMDSNSFISSQLNYVLASNITGHGQFNNNGVFIVQSPNNNTLQLNGNFINSGEFYFLDNDIYVASFAQNSASFDISSTGVLQVGTFTQNTGITTVNTTFVATISTVIKNGTLVISKGGIVASDTANYGQLIGQGRVLGSVFNYGTVGSSNAISSLTFSNFTQQAGGITNIYVSDLNSFTTINVTGHAELGGVLNIILNENIKTTSDAFTLNFLITNSVSSQFSKTVFTLPAGSSQDDGCNSVKVSADGIIASFGCGIGPKPINNGSSSEDKPNNGKMKPGAVVGIILAILASLALLAVVGYFLRKHLLKRRGIREPLLGRKELN